MHRAAKFIADHAARPLAVLLLLCARRAGLRPLRCQSPYVVTVPQSDPAAGGPGRHAGRAGARSPGRGGGDRSGAGADCGSRTRQYVQIERGTTSGQTQVLFDASGAARRH